MLWRTRLEVAARLLAVVRCLPHLRYVFWIPALESMMRLGVRRNPRFGLARTKRK